MKIRSTTWNAFNPDCTHHKFLLQQYILFICVVINESDLWCLLMPHISVFTHHQFLLFTLSCLFSRMCQVQLLLRSFSSVVQCGGEKNTRTQICWCDVNLIGRSIETKNEKGRKRFRGRRTNGLKQDSFLAVLAGLITSLIFDNKFPLSLTPSPITAGIYERAWQTVEVSTQILNSKRILSASVLLFLSLFLECSFLPFIDVPLTGRNMVSRVA